MDYIQKVAPNILTTDEVFCEFWMSQLQEFPLIPVSLTNEIVAFCGEHEDARNKLLLYGEDFPKR